MAIYKQGIATSIGTRFVGSISNTGGGNGGNQTNANAIANLSNNFITARVTDIVLNEKHPRYKEVGEWNGIGTIFFQYFDGSINQRSFAYPFIPQMKNYPLVNEIVFLIAIPSKFVEGNNTFSLDYYYLPAAGIWNHPHHNAYPDVRSYDQLQAQSVNDYSSINGDGTVVRRVEDGSTEINLNSPTNPSQQTFVEKSNIHPILPFSGDVIYEGRWGNSIRFGSTTILPPNSTTEAPNKMFQNNWSATGSSGDPITIIRNGQPTNSTDEGWIPITEKVSRDLSSIYLTSYQQIPFSLANENFISYTTPPTTPSQYTNPQIILNSNRIVINAKSDSVLISGQSSVGISSNGSVNIDATSHYISSNDIKLGSKNATQPVLLGNDTVDLLVQLTEAVKNLASILQVQRDYPGGALTTSYNSIAGNVLTQINDPKNGILAQLNNNSLKSKTTKVQ
jgi:hypothetical protein